MTVDRLHNAKRRDARDGYRIVEERLLCRRRLHWIQTELGDGWFALVRFYAPTEKLFDKSWLLGDFEKVK